MLEFKSWLAEVKPLQPIFTLINKNHVFYIINILKDFQAFFMFHWFHFLSSISAIFSQSHRIQKRMHAREERDLCMLTICHYEEETSNQSEKGQIVGKIFNMPLIVGFKPFVLGFDQRAGLALRRDKMEMEFLLSLNLFFKLKPNV